ncbi:MAG TPA: iron chelate uptake ABC transporter family permease subunit [Patescibacteria group bacterium]|nr:iron chelate uptake ABC transporter family permease subunit [Patescibacteria group bacterium]
MLEIFSYPFMQRALLAGIIVGVLLAALGVYVVVRKMAFFGDGIAHASLAGVAIGLLAGFAPLPIAIVYAILVALAIYWFEANTKLNSDTIIGIFFTASMALGVVLMSFIPGFQPELISFLFGNILSISTSDVITVAILSVVIMTWLLIYRRHLTYISLDKDSAKIAGINSSLHDIIFYIALATAVVLGVKILGIILVSALLLIPAATSRLLTGTFNSFFWVSIVVSMLSVVLGLLLSFFLDAPSGATIILVATAVFFMVAIVTRVSTR